MKPTSSSPAWRATFFFQAEDAIRDWSVTGVQTCALPILAAIARRRASPESLLAGPAHATVAPPPRPGAVGQVWTCRLIPCWTGRQVQTCPTNGMDTG